MTLNHDLIFPPPGAVESIPFNGNEALDTANVRRLITTVDCICPICLFENFVLCFFFRDNHFCYTKGDRACIQTTSKGL